MGENPLFHIKMWMKSGPSTFQNWKCVCSVEQCGCYVEHCGGMWMFLEQCGCNLDSSHLHISQFDQGLSPPWSVILKYGDVEQCGCNVDHPQLHISQFDKVPKTDQKGRKPSLIWVFTGRMSFCWFCHAAALSHILEFINRLWERNKIFTNDRPFPSGKGKQRYI